MNRVSCRHLEGNSRNSQNADYNPWLIHPQTHDSAASVGTEAVMHQLAKALGERIRTQRKAKGFSQDALAHSCSVDRSYMGRIERGEVNITVEKLYRIATVLECEPQFLLPEALSLNELASDLAASD
ncbi:HTH-type transcriptional regulator SinR [compost metagenome]